MKKNRIKVLLLALLLAACKGDGPLSGPKKAERLGRYPSALTQYEDFIAKNPGHELVPEVLYRCGEIYRNVIGDPFKARDFYEKIIRVHPETSWADEAVTGLMHSPDYFPFPAQAKRVLGDSQSGGENMKAVETFRLEGEAPPKAKVRRKIFAGDVAVSSLELVYEKKDLELREYKSGSKTFTVILKYPPKKGVKWESLRDKKRVLFSVEEDQQVLVTKNGRYDRCVKVKEQDAKSPSNWKYEYYAPGIGHVLTSAASARQETRILELISQGDDADAESAEPDKAEEAEETDKKGEAKKPGLWVRFKGWAGDKKDRVKAKFTEIKEKVKNKMKREKPAEAEKE